jgi:transcriptional regulator GlxA family with amidase domain
MPVASQGSILSEPNKPLEIGFLVVDGFSMMCFANAVEPLRAANMILGERLFQRRIITPDGKPVSSSSNLSLLADSAVAGKFSVDWLFVISSYDYQKFLSKELLSAIRRLARPATIVAGLDTGSWLLAAAGLLDQHRATMHWQELALFAERFKQVNASDQRYVIDRRRASAGGATATLDLMLELIRLRCGESLFFDVRNLFLYDVNHPADRRQQRYSLLVHRVPKLYKAISLMEQSIEFPLSISIIARQTSISLRTLNRLFKQHMGQTPGQYYLQLRLKSARRLIAETQLSMTEVALRCGFNSPQAFSRAFRAKFSTFPKDFRRGRIKSVSFE